MKKVIFLLLALGFTSFGIYSCQKDNAEKAVQPITPNLAASDRTDYTDCDERYQNCNDCCLKLENIGTINTNFGFVNPATGLSTFRVVPPGGTLYVCAASGWLAIFGSGLGRITVCSSGKDLLKATATPNIQEELSWDCQIII